MNTVSTNLTGTTGQNQIIADLRKASVQQDYQRTNVELTRTQNIFNQSYSDYSNTEKSFLNSIFEKQLNEVAYKSVQDNLSFLRSKERTINITEELSTTKFIKHEEQLKANPEIAGIENQIKTNKTTIQTKQQELDKKTAATEVYQALIQKSAALNNKINLLLTSELTLVSDINNIKAQIAELKNSSATVSKIQASLTGSESTTGVDTAKSGDAEVVIAVGGQQSATSNKEVADSLKTTIQSVSQNQEIIDAKIKEASIASLEDLLKQKEQQLSTTRDQISQNRQQLTENETLVQTSKGENDTNVAQRNELAAEIKTLIANTDALVMDRLKKDPAAVKYSSVSTVFDKVLQGSTESGVGVEADLEETRADAEAKKNKYSDTTYQADDLQEIFNVKNFLKSSAKSNLEKSQARTEEQKKVFESLDIAA